MCRTAVYGPVRTVVWQGGAREDSPYADCENQMAPDGQAVERGVLGSAIKTC